MSVTRVRMFMTLDLLTPCFSFLILFGCSDSCVYKVYYLLKLNTRYALYFCLDGLHLLTVKMAANG